MLNLEYSQNLVSLLEEVEVEEEVVEEEEDVEVGEAVDLLMEWAVDLYRKIVTIRFKNYCLKII
jgi:hypothetical protein